MITFLFGLRIGPVRVGSVRAGRVINLYKYASYVTPASLIPWRFLLFSSDLSVAATSELLFDVSYNRPIELVLLLRRRLFMLSIRVYKVDKRGFLICLFF